MKRRWFIVFSLLAVLLLWWIFALPENLFQKPTSTVIFDRDGVLLGARIAEDGQWRFAPSGNVPPRFETALLNYEDAGFKEHWGISPSAIIRASVQNFSEGRVVSGASTITMQVLRMSREAENRSVFQKIIEMALALRLELRHSKEEILNLYVSNAPFGGNVVGLEAAAWRYYGKPANAFSWSEAAAMAVLPNAPGMIFPGKSPEAFLQKRNGLLKKLFEKGIIDKPTYELSLLEPLPSAPVELPMNSYHILGRAEKEHQGKNLTTTLDYHLQEKLTELLNYRLRELNRNHIQNGAILVADNRTGEILAYVGNSTKNLRSNENANDMVMAPRSSGSILKPFLHAELLDAGFLLPRQLVADIPTQYQDFAPKNFDETFSGAVPANEALSRSLNIPAVRLLDSYGIDFFHRDLQHWQFKSINRPADNYGLSLILGGAETRLWDLVQAYQLLGVSLLDQEASALHYLKDWDTTSVGIPVGRAAAWFTIQALSEVIRPEDRAAWKAFGNAEKIAWKTGTSFGFRDAWAVGITPSYTVGIWVGNSDGEGRPGLTGLHAAAPILFDVFNVLQSSAWFKEPVADIDRTHICLHSGMRASKNCPETTYDPIPKIGSTSPLCVYCRLIHLDDTKAFRVSSSCYPTHRMISEGWFNLPPLQEWFYRKVNPSYRLVPDWLPDCASADEESEIRLVYPSSSSTVFLPREYAGEKEKLIFKAACRNPNSTIFWHMDEKFLGSTVSIHHLEVKPEPGKHLITLLDEDGTEFKTWIEVLE